MKMVRCCLLILRSTRKTLQTKKDKTNINKKTFFLKPNIYLTNKNRWSWSEVGETMWITAIPSSAEKTFTDSCCTCCSLAVTPTDRRCVSPYGAFKLYMVSTVYTVYVFALAEQGSAIVHLCSVVWKSGRGCIGTAPLWNLAPPLTPPPCLPCPYLEC